MNQGKDESDLGGIKARMNQTWEESRRGWIRPGMSFSWLNKLGDESRRGWIKPGINFSWLNKLGDESRQGWIGSRMNSVGDEFLGMNWLRWVFQGWVNTTPYETTKMV